MNNSRSVTISGLIRKHLREIEQRMYEGESQTSIVADLNEKNGKSISLKDFRQLLLRARKAAQKKTLSTEITETPAAESSPLNSTPLAKDKNPAAPKTDKPLPNTVSKSSKLSLDDMKRMFHEPLDLDDL